jgi:hypothetical protein
LSQNGDTKKGSERNADVTHDFARYRRAFITDDIWSSAVNAHVASIISYKASAFGAHGSAPSAFRPTCAQIA